MNKLQGQIDDFRISKGIARWTGKKKFQLTSALIMNVSIAAAWIVLGVAFLVLSGCSDVPAPQQTAKTEMVALNCDECLKMPSDAILVDGVLNYYIYGNLQPYNVRSFKRAILLTETQTGTRAMRINMFSGGGNAYVGPAFADAITDAQNRGWSVEIHGTGLIASAAIPVFAVSYPRYATFGTIFMVHPIQGGRLDEYIREQFMRQYVTYLVLTTKVGRVEWRKKVDDTTWFTAGEALEWGLVDAIQ
jgi:ATP-dependent protease ClpP protease subunit